MKNGDMTNKELIEKLEKLNEDVRTLLHDIGSPLSAIWGYTNLATLWLQKEEGDKDEITEYLNEINGHMGEIEQIIKGASPLINGIRNEQIDLDDSQISDAFAVEHVHEGATEAIALMFNRLRDLLDKSESIANIHMNEEDITGTEVEIRHTDSDHIKAIFPKQMDFYLLIPLGTIHYIKVKPSNHHVDIYLR